jgi:hypothetical protein
LFLPAFPVVFWLFLAFAEGEGPFSRELGDFFRGILAGRAFLHVINIVDAASCRILGKSGKMPLLQNIAARCRFYKI